MIIGLILGSLAGFFGGKVDDVVMWFITVFWSIPDFSLSLGISAECGRFEVLDDLCCCWFDDVGGDGENGKATDYVYSTKGIY
jgi:ABC-type dipeptide/oligopeptide/nickel transport system permease subunit